MQAALVVSAGTGCSAEELEVVDLVRIQPLSTADIKQDSPTLFIIETKPFHNSKYLKDGAGEGIFTPEEIQRLISSL